MRTFPLLLLCLIVSFTVVAQPQVEQWGMFEVTLQGSDAGNPFIEVPLTAEFVHDDTTYTPDGFYDGDGTYKVRFMPDREGNWTYTTHSKRADLDGKTGSFTCTAPSPNNHGPVQVRNQFHFGYADATPFYPFGTTIYEWAFTSPERQQQTIQTLQGSPFNKARFLAVPPYKGYYLEGPLKITEFPFEGTSKADWDFSRFNPAYFQALEERVAELRDIGVQADLILFRPYDGGKWGFDQMDMATNQRFLRYVIARLGAYRNIWWSLANENSFIRHLTDEDWDVLFQTVQQHDPYQHLRSIHNAGRLYDYTKPWVTHVSLQYYNAVKVFGVSPLLRDIYQKPIVHDEINYEGNIERRWGQLSGEEMTYRFWVAYIGGAYATHGEAIEGGWLSLGGELTGESPSRIAFLKEIVEAGPPEGLEPLDHYYLTNVAGKYAQYYLFYFGKEQQKTWDFILTDEDLAPGMKFKVDVIDTWNRTITPVDRVFEVEELDNYRFVDKHRAKVKLPNRPYMALRIQRIDEATQPSGKDTQRDEADEL
ncbi:Protein of unknown function [Catalinimonas alkaloidigena]|uniref:DUF5060 domain-containing protein n=1 Tax=Catalinimonas alkaloidigena TaxID=1075417 RepID=A0A1G9QHJ6_9BACT|nr:DUF5060 domain-containing protein [Catalinimonas alkaloidigena]SDM10456.1 Protein of unknown function [Catalinimonas alkaloidigena]